MLACYEVMSFARASSPTAGLVPNTPPLSTRVMTLKTDL